MNKGHPLNPWTGTVLTTEHGFGSFDDDAKVDAQLEYALEEYFFNHLAGISILEGGGSLPPIWDEVEEELISQGLIAVVEYLDEKFLASVAIPADTYNADNLLRRFDTVELTLLSNKAIKLKSTKGPRIDKNTGKKIIDAKGYPYKFVVFQNNRDCIGYLNRIRYYIRQMVDCVKKMRWDLFMSQKRLIIFAKEQPDDEDVDLFLEGWRKREVTIMTVQKSRRPGKEARAEGKEGLSPHELNFTTYEPKTDERAKIIRDFNWWLSLAEKLTGVRSDVLQEKQERASVQEVLNSSASFDAFEKKGAKWRMKGLREYILVFDEKDANLTLTYGKVERQV
jgi:hypothetical protein